MFTVKTRNKAGHENLFEARRVEWIETPIRNGGQYDTMPGLLVHYEDGGTSHYGLTENNTDVWVMNRWGATVSHYKF